MRRLHQVGQALAQHDGVVAGGQIIGLALHEVVGEHVVTHLLQHVDPVDLSGKVGGAHVEEHLCHKLRRYSKHTFILRQRIHDRRGVAQGAAIRPLVSRCG